MRDVSIDINERDLREHATVVGNLAEFPLGALKLVKVDGRRLCVVHTSSGVHALDNACPHEGYGLTTGELDGELLTRMRDQLDSCIGCGCLSLTSCGLWNPDDVAAASGDGPRYLLSDDRPYDD